MDTKNFNRRYKRITSFFNEVISRDEKALKEYLSEFTDERLFTFSKSTDEESDVKKVFITKYYLCAAQFAESVEQINSMPKRIYKLINDTHSLGDSELQNRAVGLFEAAAEISRATEIFLSGSEAIVSGKAEFSYSTLHRLALSLNASLKDIKSRLEN